MLLLPARHRDDRDADAARRRSLEAAAPQGFALATDVAEWLVSNGVPFRSAHEISGAMVSFCEEAGLELDQLDDDQLAGIDERLTPDVRSVLSVPGALAARKARGGTAPERVAEQLTALKAPRDRARRLGVVLTRGGRALSAGFPRPDPDRPEPGPLLTEDGPARAGRRRGAVPARLLGGHRPAGGPGRAAADRGRGVLGGGAGPGVARPPRADPARRDHVRPARAALRLLQLRRALVRERRRRAGRAAARRCCCGPGEVVVGEDLARVAPPGRPGGPRPGPRAGAADPGARHRPGRPGRRPAGPGQRRAAAPRCRPRRRSRPARGWASAWRPTCRGGSGRPMRRR